MSRCTSGYAGTAQVVTGMTQKCEAHGVRCHWGVEVLDYDMTAGRVAKVRTSAGEIACDAVVLAPGAWLPQHWQKLGRPATLDLHYPDGSVAKARDMWTYWRLREGEIYHAPPYRDARDLDQPVLHVELMDTPVLDPETGDELADHLYVYWKNGAERMDKPGIQGGILPVELGPEATVEPYGHASDDYQAEPFFAEYICAAMGPAHGPLRGLPQELPRAPQRRHRRLHPGQRADLRLGPARPLHDRRLESRLQNDRGRQAGRKVAGRR